VGIGKDMCAGLPVSRKRNPGYRSGDLLDAMYDRGSSDMMDALAKRAILMGNAVYVDVGDLDGCAIEQKDGDDGNQQKTNGRVPKPIFAAKSHSYC